MGGTDRIESFRAEKVGSQLIRNTGTYISSCFVEKLRNVDWSDCKVSRLEPLQDSLAYSYLLRP